MRSSSRNKVWRIGFETHANIPTLQANALAPNWGQSIFQTANEIAANTVLRERLDEIQAQATQEKEWWEKRRATVRSEFMKELEGEETGTGTGTPVDSSSVASSPSKKKGKN